MRNNYISPNLISTIHLHHKHNQCTPKHTCHRKNGGIPQHSSLICVNPGPRASQILFPFFLPHGREERKTGEHLAPATHLFRIAMTLANALEKQTPRHPTTDLIVGRKRKGETEGAGGTRQRKQARWPHAACLASTSKGIIIDGNPPKLWCSLHQPSARRR